MFPANAVVVAAFALPLAGCSSSQPTDQARNGSVTLVNMATNASYAPSGCGGVNSEELLRDCAVLGKAEHYTGIFYRHLEGGGLMLGAEPGKMFCWSTNNTFELVVDDETRDSDLLPDRDSSLPVTYAAIAVVGQKVIPQPNDDTGTHAPKFIIADRVIRANNIPESQVLRHWTDDPQSGCN